MKEDIEFINQLAYKKALEKDSIEVLKVFVSNGFRLENDVGLAYLSRSLECFKYLAIIDLIKDYGLVDNVTGKVHQFYSLDGFNKIREAAKKPIDKWKLFACNTHLEFFYQYCILPSEVPIFFHSQEEGSLGVVKEICITLSETLEDASNLVKNGAFIYKGSAESYTYNTVKDLYNIPEVLIKYINFEGMAKELEEDGCCLYEVSSTKTIVLEKDIEGLL